MSYLHPGPYHTLSTDVFYALLMLADICPTLVPACWKIFLEEWRQGWQ